MSQIEEEPGTREGRGFGPLMRADDGTTFQITEEDVWNAMPAMAACLILMAAWDFSRQAEWTLGERRYYFGEALRTLVLGLGFAIAAWISLVAYRDAKRRDEAEREAASEGDGAGREIADCPPAPETRPRRCE